MAAMSRDQYIQMIYDTDQHLTQLRVEKWLNLDLFSWQWWILVVLLILPWLIWWKYADKKRLPEIFIVGLMVLILSSYMDAILSELSLWNYHYWVIPYWPRLISADFSFIPVCFMLVYQKYRTWPSYLAANALLAFLLAVPTEMILVWADIFQMNLWRSYYGIPIFFAMGILVRLLTQTLMKKQVQAL